MLTLETSSQAMTINQRQEGEDIKKKDDPNPCMTHSGVSVCVTSNVPAETADGDRV